jgi:DNA-binding transcriptional LysR family regulator
MAMDITIRHVEVFRAVMTAGSVTRAAALLRTSQPTVSRELGSLEELLEVALFVREHGRLTPTAEANILFDEVRRSYAGLERVAGVALSLKRFEQGQLAIACLPTFAQTLLPGACRAFLADYPAVRVSVTPQESPLLEESLAAQRYDLGLSESDLAPQGTSAEPLFAGDMVCVLPAAHPLARRDVLELADFDGQDFVSLSVLDLYRRQLDDLFEQAGVQRHIAVETASAASVCAMVRQGLGVAIVNPLTALDEAGPELAGRGLAVRRFARSVPFRVALVRPLHRPPSVLTDAYCATLRAHAGALAAALA